MLASALEIASYANLARKGIPVFEGAVAAAGGHHERPVGSQLYTAPARKYTRSEFYEDLAKHHIDMARHTSGKRRRVGPAPFIGPTMEGRNRWLVGHGEKGYIRTSGYYGRMSTMAGERTKENKFFDTDVGFTFDLTGEIPATGQLNLIDQGTGESQRIGRKTTIHSIQFRGIMEFSPGASTQANAVTYMYVVQDTQCNGAAATLGDVLTSVSMEKGMINLANSQRFRIIKRFVTEFNPSAAMGAGDINRVIHHIEWFKKCSIPVEFSANTGAIGEIRSNNLFLLAGSTGSTSDDLIAFRGTCRLRFSD